MSCGSHFVFVVNHSCRAGQSAAVGRQSTCQVTRKGGPLSLMLSIKKVWDWRHVIDLAIEWQYSSGKSGGLITHSWHRIDPPDPQGRRLCSTPSRVSTRMGNCLLDHLDIEPSSPPTQVYSTQPGHLSVGRRNECWDGHGHCYGRNGEFCAMSFVNRTAGILTYIWLKALAAMRPARSSRRVSYASLSSVSTTRVDGPS